MTALKPHIYLQSGEWKIRFPPPLSAYNHGMPHGSFARTCNWARVVFEGERRRAREKKRSAKTRWFVR